MTTFASIGLGRTLDAGVNLLLPTDVQLSVITANGVVSVYLPSVSSILQARSGSGNLQTIQFILADISNLAATNNIILYAAAGETINGAASVTLNVNGISVILTPTTNNSWSSISSTSGGNPTPPFDNPLDFFLDANAPSGGDGSIERPFNTITALNNHVLSLDPSKSYIGNIAPAEGYGSEVVGTLNIAPNLSLVGVTPQNTGIGCNVLLTAPALLVVNVYRNISFNGTFTLDLALASFASISFQTGAVNLSRIDSNPSTFVGILGGIGTSTISGGTVVIQGGLLIGDITVNGGATLLCTNIFSFGSKFKLNGNSTLKTLSTLNPFDGYVDGVVDVSGTPTWLTDAASNANFTGTVNKTVY